MDKGYLNRFVTGFLSLFLCLTIGAAPAFCQGDAGKNKVIQVNTVYQNYDGLAELVTIICDDVMDKMQGFFGPTVVDVQPFICFGQYQENKISSLGITLADQMIAMVNNDGYLRELPEDSFKYAHEYKQKMRGSLQEVDGYLHIHISAANVYGQRISYTTNVEMSEPIYRALHTYL